MTAEAIRCPIDAQRQRVKKPSHPAGNLSRWTMNFSRLRPWLWHTAGEILGPCGAPRVRGSRLSDGVDIKKARGKP